MAGSFTIIDYAVLVGTLVISMMIGVYYGLIKKQKTNSDLLVGGRSMPIIPTSLSLLATYMSPILVLGYTGEIYSYGTLMVETIFVAFIFVPIAALIFMPVLYPLKLTSAYEYLENRFESPTVRLIASITFMLQASLYMGVVLFAPALALNSVVDFPVDITIWLIGGCAAVYTSIGGLKAVVWTDVFQMVIMLAGMLAIVIEGTIQAGGLQRVFDIAQEHKRIEFLNFEFNPFRRVTSLSIFFGHGIMVLNVCGCQQTSVQRYSSMSSLKKGIWTMMITLPLVAFTVGLAALGGIVIFANYATCDPITIGVIKRNDQIAPYFVLQYLSPTSGLLGLFIACLFSASMSTVSSGLNSLSAVFYQDVLAKIDYFKNMSENAQGLSTKIAGFVYGLVIIGMAFLAGNFDGVLAASIILNGSVAGPLLGVFLMGILIPFTNKYGAIVGMLAGHALTIWICIGGALLGRKSPTLPFSIDGCSEEMLNAGNKTAVFINSTSFPIQLDEVAWPQKIFTVSFLLYPLIGCTICIVFGMIVSLLTGRQELRKDQEKYIHPALVKIMKSFSERFDSSLELSKSSKSYNVTTTSYNITNSEINDLNKDTSMAITSSYSKKSHQPKSETIAEGKKSLQGYENTAFNST